MLAFEDSENKDVDDVSDDNVLVWIEDADDVDDDDE